MSRLSFRAACVLLLAILTGVIPARADGLFDQVGKAIDTISKLRGTATGSTPVPGLGSLGDAGAALRGSPTEPFGLVAYPRSRLASQYANPLERGRMPLSKLEPTPADGLQPRLSVPYEGSVHLYGYELRPDDSPLLVRRHYENILLQQGFQTVFICEDSCGGGRVPWRAQFDPAQKLDPNIIPEGHSSYLVAEREGNLVLVGVGQYISSYSVVVKTVEGRILDRRPVEAAVAALSASMEGADGDGGAPLLSTGSLPTCVALVRARSKFPNWTVRNECGKPIAINYCWSTSVPAWKDADAVCANTGMLSSGLVAAGKEFSFARRPASGDGTVAAPVQIGAVCDMSAAGARCGAGVGGQQQQQTAR